MRRCLAALVLLAVARWAVAAPEVLVPSDGERVWGDAAWLVVRAPEPPSVTVDGATAPVVRSEQGVHHVRLGSLRTDGSRVVVSWPGGSASLAVYGGAARPTGFHAGADRKCTACHDLGDDGCAGCHRWPDTRHTELLTRGCALCHPGPGRLPASVEAICGECHEGYLRKHPGLRHALRSARDPRRPGRPMDCASCHDPHKPRCLSCLGRKELRNWCRTCHSR